MATATMSSAGAVLAGRRWYDLTPKLGGVAGIYGGNWKGPVFVLTDRPPGGEQDPRLTFLSGDIEEAIKTAKKAASGQNVVLFAASIPKKCMLRRLLDEIVIHLVPVLPGSHQSCGHSLV